MQYTSVIKFARSTAKAWFKDESSSDRHNAFASTLDKIRKNALALERRQNKSDGKSFPRLVEELQRLRILSDTHVSLQVFLLVSLSLFAVARPFLLCLSTFD